MGKTNKDQLGNKINFDFTSNLPVVILSKTSTWRKYRGSMPLYAKFWPL